MSLAVLELNDQSLLIQADGGSLCAEPGFARLTTEGIETGEPARATAWREPQHSYNQFWSQLNQTPMAAKQNWARHHADMAFAQLRSLSQQAESPDSLVLLVPGSCNDTQLSLLLGMAAALPAKIVAVIDNALVASLDIEQRTVFVDLALHQTALTVCEPAGETVEILDQEVFPDLGMMQIHNSVARHISNLLIDSNRFDPLHSSSSEQTIFDRIPAWLDRLRWEKELSAVLETEQGELPFILRNDAVRKLVGERMSNVHSFIEKQGDSQLVLSHPSSLMAGLSNEFADAQVLEHAAGIEQFRSNESMILDQVDGLYRVRSLQRQSGSARPVQTAKRAATHLLYRDQALPLREPVSISLNGQGLQLTGNLDHRSALTLVMNNRKLQAVHRDPGVESQLPKDCHPGETIKVGEHELTLIEVRDK